MFTVLCPRAPGRGQGGGCVGGGWSGPCSLDGREPRGWSLSSLYISTSNCCNVSDNLSTVQVELTQSLFSLMYTSTVITQQLTNEARLTPQPSLAFSNMLLQPIPNWSKALASYSVLLCIVLVARSDAYVVSVLYHQDVYFLIHSSQSPSHPHSLDFILCLSGMGLILT